MHPLAYALSCGTAQERLCKWVYEVGLQHAESRVVSQPAVKLACGALRITKEDQLRFEFMMKAAADNEPEPPAALPRLDQQYVLLMQSPHGMSSPLDV